MSSYELTFTDIPKTDRNLKTGRFIKGMTPHNKGKKWSEWMDGRKQKRVKKQALANLDKGRRTKGRLYGGRPKRKVIAVTDEGEFFVFAHAKKAVEWSGGCPDNIRRCCRDNERTTLTKSGKVNDEHKYLGFRWYFESDYKWTNKIRK